MSALVSKRLEGWRLTGTIAILLLITAGVLLVGGGGDTDSVRSVIRLTARTSVVLFLLAFTASSAAVAFPGRLTRWQRRNRRYLGVSFAASHLIHAFAFGSLFLMDPPLFWTLASVGTIVSGGITYLFIAAMAATSFDAAVRWIGPRRWRALHSTGTWFIWISFLAAYGLRIPKNAWYATAVVLLILGLVVRVLAWIAVRRTKALSATGSA